MLPYATTADIPVQIETVEFLDGIEEQQFEADKSMHTIGTNGYWQTGTVLLVHVSAGEAVDDNAVESATRLINSSTDSTVAEWNHLLSTFEGSAPLLSVTQDAGEADIKVLLTDYEHPEGMLGKARLYVIKDVGQIISAEVEIFAASKVHSNGLLEYALAHELGHALGLFHSTDPDSIMHNMLRLENGAV